MAKPKLKLTSFTGLVKAASGVAPDADIDVTLIDVERQVRTELGDLTDLAASIKQIGVIEPILLLEKDDGRFRLIAGERRYRATLLAGLPNIPAVIRRGLSIFEIRQIQVTENNEREDLSAYDEAMGVADDVDNFGFKEAQQIWNRSEGWISKRMAVRQYVDPVRKLLKDKLCGDLEILHSLNQLYVLNEEEYGHMVRRLETGNFPSREEVRDKVAAIKRWEKEKQAKPGKTQDAQSPGKQAAKNEKAKKTAKVQEAAVANAGGAATGASEGNGNAPNFEEERRLQAEQLGVVRREIFELGKTSQDRFNKITSHLGALDFGMNESEWILWSGFLSTVLPMMHALGDERSLSYIKRLQSEFKTNSPILLWRAQHSLTSNDEPEMEDSPRIGAPDMPTDWRF